MAEEAHAFRDAAMGCCQSQVHCALSILREAEASGDPDITAINLMYALFYARLAAAHGDPELLKFAATLGAYVATAVSGTAMEKVQVSFRADALAMLDIATDLSGEGEAPELERMLHKLSQDSGSIAVPLASAARDSWGAALRPNLEILP